LVAGCWLLAKNGLASNQQPATSNQQPGFEMAKDLAIVLNNGGINSAVTTALAAQKARIVLLHVEAAEQTGSKVRAAYDLQVAHFKPYREHTLSMPFLSILNHGSPTQPVSDPRQVAPLAPQMMELLPLVAAAARFAAQYQALSIYLGTRIGGNGDELAEATEFFQIWDELLQGPCGHPDLKLETPLLELEAWQVVDVGFQVSTPFERTWSCNEQGNDPCWACRGCRAREAAFQQSGKPDPMRVVRRV
jgi:7-cyano-7-deazaguanine synthase